MKFNTLHEVLADYVRDLYNAETQIVKALTKMVKAASSLDLRAAFEEHLNQTKEHVSRLEKIAETLGVRAKGKTCHAMKGLIEESEEVISSTGDPATKDAALIGAAQRIEHYEIAGYGTARTFARVLGEQSVADLLQQTLDEEGDANKKLTALAESGLNQEAAEEDAGDTPRDDALAERETREFTEANESTVDVEEEAMRTGVDDDSVAAAPSPRGQTATGDRHAVPTRTRAHRGH